MVKLPDPKRCPICREKRTRVVDSREVRGYIRRRRRCGQCKRDWETYETIVDPRDLPKNLIEANR